MHPLARSFFACLNPAIDYSGWAKGSMSLYFQLYVLRAILCKYGASYIGTISRSDSDFDETCWQC